MIDEAVKLIRNSKHITVFTGAGISVESGIPTFRGKNGLWSKYDPKFLEISYFYSNPEKSWELIGKIFYDFFGQSKPNLAHRAIAEMERFGIISTVITQNIDGLHQEAGSVNVLEFHGSSKRLTCTECSEKFEAENVNLKELPPKCNKCGGLLKPDFIFFGEPIPEPAGSLSFDEAEKADLFIVIGTSGEIMPASLIPIEAKKNGAKIIEINKTPSNYTAEDLPDIFLQGKATEILEKISRRLDISLK